jgi:hypothetical protein
MQRIFIVHENYNSDDAGSYHRVNDFIGEIGFIVGVYPQEVAIGGDSYLRGHWLVVADNGKKTEVKL